MLVINVIVSYKLLKPVKMHGHSWCLRGKMPVMNCKAPVWVQLGISLSFPLISLVFVIKASKFPKTLRCVWRSGIHSFKLPHTEFVPTLKSLLGNPVYIIYLCVTIIQFNSLIGMVTYKPKYIEQHYGQSASKANFLMGKQTISIIHNVYLVVWFLHGHFIFADDL